jgi:hypothetical protein
MYLKVEQTQNEQHLCASNPFGGLRFVILKLQLKEGNISPDGGVCNGITKRTNMNPLFIQTEKSEIPLQRHCKTRADLTITATPL